MQALWWAGVIAVLADDLLRILANCRQARAVGVKGAQIVNLARDLARALAMVSIRVVETVPGKSCMALELPNPKRQMVKLSEIISSKPYNDMSSPLTVCLGKDIGGQPVVADLAKTPHLLVAGLGNVWMWRRCELFPTERKTAQTARRVGWAAALVSAVMAFLG